MVPTVIEAVSAAAAFMIKAAAFLFGVRFARSLYTGKIKVRQYFECAFLAAIFALVIGSIGEAKPGERTSEGIEVFVIAFTALAYGTSTRSRAKPFRERTLPGPIG
jgi:hypothetical protein